MSSFGEDWDSGYMYYWYLVAKTRDRDTSENDLALSFPLEDVRILVCHEAVIRERASCVYVDSMQEAIFYCQLECFGSRSYKFMSQVVKPRRCQQPTSTS